MNKEEVLKTIEDYLHKSSKYTFVDGTVEYTAQSFNVGAEMITANQVSWTIKNRPNEQGLGRLGILLIPDALRNELIERYGEDNMYTVRLTCKKGNVKVIICVGETLRKNTRIDVLLCKYKDTYESINCVEYFQPEYTPKIKG